MAPRSLPSAWVRGNSSSLNSFTTSRIWFGPLEELEEPLEELVEVPEADEVSPEPLD
jgi:hypothetical protein